MIGTLSLQKRIINIPMNQKNRPRRIDFRLPNFHKIWGVSKLPTADDKRLTLPNIPIRNESSQISYKSVTQFLIVYS